MCSKISVERESEREKVEEHHQQKVQGEVQDNANSKEVLQLPFNCLITFYFILNQLIEMECKKNPENRVTGCVCNCTQPYTIDDQSTTSVLYNRVPRDELGPIQLSQNLNFSVGFSIFTSSFGPIQSRNEPQSRFYTTEYQGMTSVLYNQAKA